MFKSKSNGGKWISSTISALHCLIEDMNTILKVSDEQIKQARDTYGKTAESIAEDVDMVKKWFEKQPHLPQTHESGRLERFLLRNKFRLEQTKEKQDAYYTLRGIYTDIFKTVDPIDVKMINIRKALVWIPMPDMTPKMERIIIFKIIEDECRHYNASDWVCYVLHIMDLCITYDYSLYDRLVMDFDGFTMAHYTRMDLKSIYQGALLNQKAFSGRFSGIDIINGPNFIELILTFLKAAFSAKLFGKIKVHKTLKSLHEDIPISSLPKELGGTGESIFPLHEKWGDAIKEHRQYLMDNGKRISNEELRQDGSKYNDLFGVDGTFKKLQVD